MLALLLFSDAIADAAPPPAPTLDPTRVTVSLSATGAPQSSTYGPGSSSSGARGNGEVDVTAYPWAPLVDDASPRSLQPFLERTSYVMLDVGGQYLAASYSPGANGGTYAQTYVPASVSTRTFFVPAFAFLGLLGADYNYDRRTSATAPPTARTLWEPWAQVGLQARAGDASLSLQWQFVTVQETGPGSSPPGFFLPRLSLAGRVVLGRRYNLTASVAVIPDGAGVQAGFAVYPTKDLGLSLFGQYDHGQIDWGSTTIYDQIRGGPALSYWLSRRAALSLSYTPQWERWGSSDTEWEQTFSLGFTARIP